MGTPGAYGLWFFKPWFYRTMCLCLLLAEQPRGLCVGHRGFPLCARAVEKKQSRRRLEIVVCRLGRPSWWCQIIYFFLQALFWKDNTSQSTEHFLEKALQCRVQKGMYQHPPGFYALKNLQKTPLGGCWYLNIAFGKFVI